MSTLRDALFARVNADARPSTRIRIYLDPAAASHLVELRAEAADLRETAPRKMNGRQADLAVLIEEADAALRASTAYVILRALNSDQLAAAVAGITPEDPLSLLWRAKLRTAFVRVEDADGTVVDDITADDWAMLVENMSATEVQVCHTRLDAAETAANPS